MNGKKSGKVAFTSKKTCVSVLSTTSTSDSPEKHSFYTHLVKYFYSQWAKLATQSFSKTSFAAIFRLSLSKVSIFFTFGVHSHSTYARRGEEGVAKKTYICVRGGGGSLRSSTYACKKNSCTFSSLLNKMKQLERPKGSDITQCDEENEFHFNKSPDVILFLSTRLLVILLIITSPRSFPIDNVQQTSLIRYLNTQRPFSDI